MVVVADAAICFGLLHDHPERDDAEAADRVTEDLLRRLGLSRGESREICLRPLPGLDEIDRDPGGTPPGRSPSVHSN